MMKKILIILFLVISSNIFAQVDTLDGVRRDWKNHREKINNNDMYLQNRLNNTIHIDSVEFNGQIKFINGIIWVVTLDSAYIKKNGVYQYTTGKK